MKEGIRIAAITTGPIGRGSMRESGKRTLLIGVIGTAKGVEGVLSTSVVIDGTDSTRKIINMIKKSRFGEQVRIVAFNGIALAGLNIIDIKKINKELSARTIVITRHKPRPALMIRALRALGRGTDAKISDRIKLLKSQKKSMRSGGFYIQGYMDASDTKRVLKAALELLRLSHIISSGVSRGESKGRI